MLRHSVDEMSLLLQTSLLQLCQQAVAACWFMGQDQERSQSSNHVLCEDEMQEECGF